MVHVTAAIGLALAFLLEIIFWSVAPVVVAILVAAILLGAGVWGVMRVLRARRRRQRR